MQSDMTAGFHMLFSVTSYVLVLIVYRKLRKNEEPPERVIHCAMVLALWVIASVAVLILLFQVPSMHLTFYLFLPLAMLLSFQFSSQWIYMVQYPTTGISLSLVFGIGILMIALPIDVVYQAIDFLRKRQLTQ